MAEASRQRKHKNTGGNHIKEPLRRDEAVCLRRHKWVSQPIRPIVVQLHGRPGPQRDPPGEGHFTADEGFGADVTKATCREGKHSGFGESRQFEGLTYSNKAPMQYFQGVGRLSKCGVHDLNL